MHAATTAIMIASSELINGSSSTDGSGSSGVGSSGVGSSVTGSSGVGSSGVGCVGSCFVGSSGWIGIDAVVDGPTVSHAVADELPYESSPAKAATILYVPSSVGVQAFPNVPE